MPLLTQGKTNWKYVLIIGLLAVVAGGAILWLSTINLRTSFPVFTTGKPEKTEDETADWKTYRNEEYGFEVKYPANWFTADGKPIQDSFQVVFARSEEGLEMALHEGKLIPLTHGWPGLDINIQERSFSEAGVDILSLALDREQCQVIDFSGLQASKCLWTGINEIGDRMEPRIEFEHKGRGWIISWPTLSEKTFEYDPVYDQILSTFRFIEEDETVAWKTYKSEENGFEVKYPRSWSIWEGESGISFYAEEFDELEGHIHISRLDNVDQLSARDYVEEYRKGLIEEYLGEVVVGGVNGLKVLELGMARHTVVYLPKETDIYMISIVEGSKYEDVFNQILSTFRFLEEEESDSWETYRNEDLGFEIKYPKKEQEKICRANAGPTLYLQKDKEDLLCVDLDHGFEEKIISIEFGIMVKKEPDYIYTDCVETSSEKPGFYGPKRIAKGNLEFCETIFLQAAMGGTRWFEYFYSIERKNKYLFLNFFIDYTSCDKCQFLDDPEECYASCIPISDYEPEIEQFITQILSTLKFTD